MDKVLLTPFDFLRTLVLRIMGYHIHWPDEVEMDVLFHALGRESWAGTYSSEANAIADKSFILAISAAMFVIGVLFMIRDTIYGGVLEQIIRYRKEMAFLCAALIVIGFAIFVFLFIFAATLYRDVQFLLLK